MGIARIWLFALCLAVVLAGCASIDSSAGLYGDVPKNVDDSDEKAMLSFDVVGHDVEDIFYAVKTAAGLDGLSVDVEKKNMLSGYGLSSGPEALRCPNSKGYAFAVYLKKVRKNTTNVTVVVDAIGMCWGESQPAQRVARKLMANTNKILLSYD